jgi:hypothetical protein
MFWVQQRWKQFFHDSTRVRASETSKLSPRSLTSVWRHSIATRNNLDSPVSDTDFAARDTVNLDSERLAIVGGYFFVARFELGIERKGGFKRNEQCKCNRRSSVGAFRRFGFSRTCLQA